MADEQLPPGAVLIEDEPAPSDALPPGATLIDEPAGPQPLAPDVTVPSTLDIPVSTSAIPVPQRTAPVDYVRSNGVTQKAYGLQADDGPAWWQYMLGPLGLGLHEAAKWKRGYVDPFVSNEVQPALASAMDRPINDAAQLLGAPPKSTNDYIKDIGSAAGKLATAATGQTEEQGAAGGEALAEYITKSSLSAFIGNAPFDSLDDATKIRAINELEDLNKHPVLAHWIRKSAAPMNIKLMDAMVTENADTVGAAQMALMKETANLPLYLIGPGRMALLEGPGVGLAMARGVLGGAGPNAVASVVPQDLEVDPQGKGTNVPQSLEGAVVFGGAIGGALEGGLAGAAKIGKKLGSVGDIGEDLTKGLNIAETPGPSSIDAAASRREAMPYFQDEPPIVIGLSSDALQQMARSATDAAKQAERAAQAWDVAQGGNIDNFAMAASGSPAETVAAFTGTAEAALKKGNFKEVPRTDTKFKPNLVTLGMEDGVPVARAIELGRSGPNAGMTVPLTGPEAIAELQGLSRRWGMGPVVLQDAIFSSHPNVAPFLPGYRPGVVDPVRTGTMGASPRAQIRQEIAARSGDAAPLPSNSRQPGYMVMTNHTGGNPGAWQLHQLEDPAARVESLMERGLHEITLPDGSRRYGFIRHVDERRMASVLAPAHEEGIAKSLMYDIEVPLSKTRELDRAELEKLGAEEPAALKAERLLYRRARPVANVEEFIQNFETFANSTPETRALVERYTQRQAADVIKAPEHGTGAVLRKENVSIDLDAKAHLRRQLANQGINSQLADHLIHVANKRRQGLRPTKAEMDLLTGEWNKAQQAVQSGQLGTVMEQGPIPEPSLERATRDTREPGMPAPNDKVILASGETGEMVALTRDTAVIRVNGVNKAVHPDEVITQAVEAPSIADEVSPGAPDAPPGPPPPEPPPPPLTGEPPRPPKPHNISENNVLVREAMSKANQFHNYTVPPFSRGAQDKAQWALTMSSVKALEQTTRADVYKRLNKTFGPRTPEFQESLRHYINGRTDLPAQEQLLNKFPEVALKALAYSDNLKAVMQLNEQKLVALDILDTTASDRLDPVHLTNSYLRWMNGPGEWAKIASKNQALEQKVIARIIKEGDYAPGLSASERAAMSQEAIQYKAREFYNELIGLNDKAHTANKASMGSATQSLMKRNIELPPEYIEAMGGISDPVANIAITIGRQEALIAKGIVFRDVAASKWSSPGDMPQPGVPGWGEWVLVEGKQFGKLNGRWVDPRVWEGLQYASDMPARVHTFANVLQDMVKRNQTIYNPLAWGTNLMGNVKGCIEAGGIDPIVHPVSSAKAFAESLRLVAGSARNDVTSEAGRLLNRARSLGMFSPGLAGSELGMLRDFEKSITAMQSQMKGKLSIMDIFRKVYSLGDNATEAFSGKLGAVYDGIDQTFKMANWLALRDRGLKNPERFLGSQFNADLFLQKPERLMELVEREAARRVAVSFPMPHAPSKAAAGVRRVGSGAVGTIAPYVTMALEDMRIMANVPARMRGQGGEDGAEYMGRLLRYSLFASGLTSALAAQRRANGISDEEAALAQGSMSAAAQTYKPGLLPLFWRGPDGNPRFVDLTNAFSPLRLAQGNSDEENLVNRVFYNALKTPVSGTPAEAWIDSAMRRGGFDAAPEGMEARPSPGQLRGLLGIADMMAKAGFAPAVLSTVPRSLNQAGLVGTPPKSEFDRLTFGEAMANIGGARITPGGDPNRKRLELQFKEKEALTKLGKSRGLPEGQQPGVGSFGLQNTKEDVVRNAQDDADRATKKLQGFYELETKAKK